MDKLDDFSEYDVKALDVIPSLIRDTAFLEIEVLLNLRSSVEVQFNNETKQLKERYEKLKTNSTSDKIKSLEIDDYIYDLKSMLRDSKIKFYEFLIIGLWRVVELNIKIILAWRYAETKIKNKGFDSIKKILRRDGIDIQSVDYHDEIDKLRLLNNAIKHKGVVSPQLSQKSTCFKKGEQFSIEGNFNNIKVTFDSLFDRIPTYLEVIAIKVIPEDKYLG